MTEQQMKTIVAAATVSGALLFAAGGGLTPASQAAPRAVPVRQVAAAPAVRPAALDAVRPGLWTVRGEGLAPRRLCLGDAGALVQVRHGEAACSQLVVAGGARATTIHYSCPGAGWGRTELSLESNEAVRIDTQGVADNAPFAHRAEARREGDCSAAGS